MILVLVSWESCDNDPVVFLEQLKELWAQNIWTCTLVFSLHGLRASSWVLFVFWVLELFFSISIFTSKVSSFWLRNPLFSLGEKKNWFQRRCKILTKRNNVNNTKIFTFKKEKFSQFGWQFFIFGIWLRWQILIKHITNTTL